MTREEFQQLPVERAADLVWQLADRNGDQLEIVDIVLGIRGGASYQQACRELNAKQGRLSPLEGFYALDGVHAGSIARELVQLHPNSGAVVEDLGRRREQTTIEVIDQIMADLDRLHGPADEADSTAELEPCDPAESAAAPRPRRWRLLRRST